MRNGFLILLLFCSSFNLFAQRTNIREEDFSASDSVAAKYKGHSLHNLPALAEKLTRDLPTDVHKFRAIYKWVCENIENDYQLFIDNQRNREKLNDPAELKEWNAKVQTRMFDNLLKKRKTVCTGYAYLIKELSHFAGITAEIVDGYGRTIASNIGGKGIANHSWTAVQLEGRWYLCDATWASGAIDFTHKIFVKRYDDAYFLSDPEFFIRNHYPLDLRWTLLDQNPTLEDFLNRPIVYSPAYRHQILPVSPDRFQVESQERKVVIKIITKRNEHPSITFMLNSGSPQSAVVVEESPGNYRVECSFSRQPGGPLHVMVNGDVVFTYRLMRKQSANN
ncbi:MAG TPA: transglutaminase domain-containing protein [Chryseosolibacter sp.]